jgi:hypothetical protein
VPATHRYAASGEPQITLDKINKVTLFSCVTNCARSPELREAYARLVTDELGVRQGEISTARSLYSAAAAPAVLSLVQEWRPEGIRTSDWNVRYLRIPATAAAISCSAFPDEPRLLAGRIGAQ